MATTVAELLGAGNRRIGRGILALLVGVAVAVPLLLALILGLAGAGVGAVVLGLMSGVIVDLLAALLLLGVVTHKVNSRRQRVLARSVDGLRSRISDIDRAQRDLVTRLESSQAPLAELTARSGRLEAGLGLQAETLKRQTATLATMRPTILTATTEAANRLQATQNLFALVPPAGPVPPLVGFVAAPDVLLTLVHRLVTLRPSLAIECGSGTSTLFLALAVQKYGLDCRLVSLEHEAEYVDATRALLAAHGVAHLADVRHAPLTPTTLTDHPGSWYDPAAYADMHDIGLAFVDGPPGDVSPQARYPMVPLLADRFADTCVILLDDMRRADEQAVGKRWLEQLPGFEYRYLPFIRGCGEFTRGC